MIRIIKRNGSAEALSEEKYNRVVMWATDGIDGVSASAIAMGAAASIVDGMTTSQVHDALIKAAADLISADSPNYSQVAARLSIFKIRKDAHGQYEYPDFYEHILKNVTRGVYDGEIMHKYSCEEIDELGAYMKPERDDNFGYAATTQLRGKYLVQHRVNGEIYESPQHIYMLVGMCLYQDWNNGDMGKTRLEMVKGFYDVTSTFKLSLPTPIMAGVRTPTRQFSSCVLIESGDSLKSINATTAAIVEYISQRAGIGVNFGSIRALGSPIRNGEATHTGVIPFLKLFQAAVKSCSQGGVRGGAATAYYPLWHLEANSLLVLKNNRGVESNRVRHMDYGVELNRLMYRRLIEGRAITLFSPHDVPGLLDAFYADQDEFERLYVQYEADPSIRKETVPAVDLFSSLMQERASTGRIYIANIDHMNTHGAFDEAVAPIKQSNLCVAPETLILTDKGYKQISMLAGSKANVWNGEEWSEVDVVKTGVNQKLIKVSMSDGHVIECTPYHKFYVQIGYERGVGRNQLQIIEKRASELNEGDRLIKFDLPVIEGDKGLSLAYENGFYSGDGCDVKNRSEQRIYLYGKKRKLVDHFSGYSCAHEGETAISLRYHGELESKYFVPDADYSIKSRLDWLAGYVDADGHCQKNGTNESLFVSSTNLEFLKDIQLMLQTLGVSAKIGKMRDAGVQPMPNGKGGVSDYHCKATWRLMVVSSEVLKLMALGFKTNRVSFSGKVPNRNAKQFNKVVSVMDEGRYDDTYCFTEPKRHMGMFNGVLTGQCAEIALPTKPLAFTDDPNGEIALCTLSAFNLGALESLADLEEVAFYAVSALDCLLDYQNYPMLAAEIPAKARRSLGVGVTNFAYWLAKNGVKYSGVDGNKLVHETFEAVQFYLLKASNLLASHKGACEWFGQTKYAKGLLPIDHYRKQLDEKTLNASHPLLLDWEALRADIAIHGLRNSTLSAQMPCETSSQITNSTNGIEPPRGPVSVKSSKDGVVKMVVPEFSRIGDSYEYLWDIADNSGYLTKVAIMQKFIDQSISANTNYDPTRFPNGRVPMQKMLTDLLDAYRMGVKTLYYHNTRDGAGAREDGKITHQAHLPSSTEFVEEEDECGGACKI